MLLIVVALIVISVRVLGSASRRTIGTTPSLLLSTASMARSTIGRFLFLLFIAFTFATADLVEKALVLLGNERVFIGTIHAILFGFLDFVFILSLLRGWIFRKSMMVNPPFLYALLLLMPAIQMIPPIETIILHRGFRLLSAHFVASLLINRLLLLRGRGRRSHQDG